jgi:hypothetical protein
MFSKIGIGQLCGFLYLFILLTSVLSKFMAGTPLDPGDVSSTLGAVAEGGRRFQISIVLDLVSHVSVVALAGALYLAFSPHNRSLALLGTLWRVAEGVIIALNELNNVVLLAVAQKFVSATGAEAVTLETLGRALIVAEDWGLKIGLAFFALGWLMYGILFVSSGAVCFWRLAVVPRWADRSVSLFLASGCCSKVGRSVRRDSPGLVANQGLTISRIGDKIAQITKT